MARLHIIGICGTAMAGLAALAQESGWQVTGSDQGVYPPMSLFLQQRAIRVAEEFSAQNLVPKPDLVLVGNAVSRGNPELEAVLEQAIPCQSGAEWLQRHVLVGRHPIVVTGTHGKTTTSSLIAWLLDYAGWQPGFLIGGIPTNFGFGARFPAGPWMVIEGDEYDTAFFDKRPKFHHYWPRTLLLHNLEFDHADIYADLAAIRQQFRLLLRLVPRTGLILVNHEDAEMVQLVKEMPNHQAAYGQVVHYGLSTHLPFAATLQQEDGRRWTLLRDGYVIGEVNWSLLGRHNLLNGLAAAAVALSHGIDSSVVCAGLQRFAGVARRLQVSGSGNGIQVYDDFAHHPTAIATTLAGLRARVGNERIWALLEPRSNTMRRRVHQQQLAAAFVDADRLLLARPAARGLPADQLLDVDAVVASCNCHHPGTAQVIEDAQEAVQILQQQAQSGDHIVIMSNGGFGGIHGLLQSQLLA
ncbi:MAG: UDP-N-acetylmuramate:L-alanyl-gamma-D-glutamyl-meso-diaminopimelate ligase [Magnetococcales bacterium]|nr:UDP-N-acetylmuramate:L-alanyl-gamma-D-glutamyl-meso-diaminopimelate ligase [Magnetococcales bacterium]